ncbi:hypothetical protein VV02_00335 [Luteipulveratus mongoliensis]|uniref:Uncharacterized protein n=1 Tax=Luteipulveratus mongoliensis TaxID=571913 RepID=A0A0K1JDK1_9MICO|nr:hypothetical protein VV02_00335 [Luteipulveratus mongoliensis]
MLWRHSWRGPPHEDDDIRRRPGRNRISRAGHAGERCERRTAPCDQRLSGRYLPEEHARRAQCIGRRRLPAHPPDHEQGRHDPRALRPHPRRAARRGRRARGARQGRQGRGSVDLADGSDPRRDRRSRPGRDCALGIDHRGAQLQPDRRHPGQARRGCHLEHAASGLDDPGCGCPA